MMPYLVPIWILGAPLVGVIVLSLLFKGPSAMGGDLPRPLPRRRWVTDSSAPLLEPVHPEAARRNI